MSQNSNLGVESGPCEAMEADLGDLIRRQMARLAEGTVPQDSECAVASGAEADEPQVQETPAGGGEREEPPTVPTAADGGRAERPRTKRVSYARLARQQRIRHAVARAATQRDQISLPLDLPNRKKPSRREDETREALLDRLLDPELTLAETAKILEVCPATVRRYADRGLLPHHRTPGNQRRFKLREVLEFLARADRSVVESVGDEEVGVG